MDFKTYIWTGETEIANINHPWSRQFYLNKFSKYDIYIEKIYFSRKIQKIHFNGKHPFRTNSDPEYINLTNKEYMEYYCSDILAGVIQGDTPHHNYAEETWTIHFSSSLDTYYGLVQTLRRFEHPELFVGLQDFRDKQIGLILEL